LRFADRRDNAFGTYKHFTDSLSFLVILVALISDTGVVAMRKCPTQTGEINHVDGVYHSQCHNAERTILEEQTFPRCGYCDSDTAWIFMRPAESAKPPLKTPTALPARRQSKA